MTNYLQTPQGLLRLIFMIFFFKSDFIQLVIRPPPLLSCHTADSKPVKQEVNDTVILPLLVFPALTLGRRGECFTTPPILLAMF